MKFEIMEWKMENKGKTYTHKVSCTVTDIDSVQVALDYDIACLDTNQHKKFGEVRSAIDGIIDLRPSFKIMQQIRESL